MASLNLSTNGPSISKSYQSIVAAPPPSGPAASSPTYGQWAIYEVSAPLVNTFQPDAGGKESVLKVHSTGGRTFYLSSIPERRSDNFEKRESL
jgi:drebrin-like protein